MFLGVRPLTEDEHLYLRLCKLGKLILFFKLRLDICFKVIWIELFLIGKRVSSDVSLNTYCDSFIMSIISFLMHPWYLSCASACNRCSGGSYASGIRASTSGGAAASSGAGGAGPRRRSQRRSSWVPRSPTFIFSERQAPEHSKTPMFSKWLLWVSLFIDALSDRNWMRTLVAYIPIPWPVYVPWILFRSRSESKLSHA